MSFPGKNYSQWHRAASMQLLKHKANFLPLQQATVELTFYPATKRKGDLSNKAEAVLDLLVDNNFLVDDNWFVVANVKLIFGCVDPANPRVLVVLK